MQKWSAGIQRELVWVHYADAPMFDTQEEAETWLRGWLAGQPAAIREDSGLYKVRQIPITEAG